MKYKLLRDTTLEIILSDKSDDDKTEERMFSENQAIWCSLIPIIIVIILIICEVIKNEI